MPLKVALKNQTKAIKNYKNQNMLISTSSIDVNRDNEVQQSDTQLS